MAKAKSRATVRKMKDKWKAKSWYRVLAPSLFDNSPIAETLAADKEQLINRVTEISMQNLTGDFRKSHIKLYFKIDKVEGSDAYTYFIGHSLTSDYIRRLIRRRKSRIDGVYDVTTKDGAIIRLKPFATTERRIQTSQKHEIRKIMKSNLLLYAKDRTLSEMIRDILQDKVSAEIGKSCKKFYPLRKVEIYKSELLKRPIIKTEEKPKEVNEEKKEEPKKGEEKSQKSKKTEKKMKPEKVGNKSKTKENKVGEDKTAAGGKSNE